MTRAYAPIINPLHEWILAYCCWLAGGLVGDEPTEWETEKPGSALLCQLKVRKTETRFRIPIFPKFFSRFAFSVFQFLETGLSVCGCVSVCVLGSDWIGRKVQEQNLVM
jgi:hypothetical protein